MTHSRFRIAGLPVHLPWCIIIALFVQYLPAAAGDSGAEDERSVVQTVGDDLVIAGSDALGWLLAPLSFDGTQWLYAAGALSIPVLAIATDEHIRIWQQPSPLGDDAAFVVKQYGEVKYAAAFALSVYAGGLALDDDDIRVTGRLLCESLLLAGITTTTVKMLSGRSRPYRGQGPWYFDPLQQDNGQLSFPSGHTTVAFAVSSVLSERIDNTWASVGLYSLASLTGLSRVYHHEHWFSDVLLGAAVGTAAGLAVTGWEEGRSRNAGEKYSVLLLPKPDGVLVVMRL